MAAKRPCANLSSAAPTGAPTMEALLVSQSEPVASTDALRIPAEAMQHYLPGGHPALPLPHVTPDVVLHLFTHRSITEPILVPAVAEPLLVMVLTGSAIVEERAAGGEWAQTEVRVGDFFLTSTTQPYDCLLYTSRCV